MFHILKGDTTMAALYVLIPVALAIVAGAIWIFFWAVDSGQYDDLDSPAHSVLFDDRDERRQLAAHRTDDHTPPHDA